MFYLVFPQNKLRVERLLSSNFLLDKIVLEELKKCLKTKESSVSTSSYLPFIDRVFNKDLQSLSSNKIILIHFFN